jgi:hypothetical protein
MEKRGRPRKGNTTLPFSELGITKMQSHRWQRLATLPVPATWEIPKWADAEV